MKVSTIICEVPVKNRRPFAFQTLCFFMILILGSLTNKAQVALPHFDPLNYTVSQSLQTQTGWAAINTGDDILISNGSLTYTGLQASSGNRATFSGAGMEASKLFTQQTSGTVYYSFLLNVSSLGSLNATGGYFTSFIDNGTGNFGATVWTRSNGAGYDIGLNPRTTAANTVWNATPTSINTTVLIVISYQLIASAGNDVVKLWINPTPGGAEPAATLTATNTGGTDLANLNKILIRQDGTTATPFIEMDEIRIGTSWASVTPSSLITQSITFNALSNATYGNPDFPLTATGGNSGNPVTYVSSNTGIATIVNGSGIVDPNGTFVHIVAAGGPINITASQAGNATYSAATPVIQPLTVNKAPQNITFGPLSSKTDAAPNFQLLATSTSSSGIPIVYTSSQTGVAIIVDGAGTPDINGTWVDIVGTGSTIITATQATNSNYALGSAQQTQTVTSAALTSQTITFLPLSNRTYGDGNFQLTATASSNLPVKYTSSQTNVAIIVDNLGNPDVNGTWVDIVGPGTTVITASQAGNATYSAATNAPQNFTVDVKPLTVTGATANNKIYDGTTAATISGGSLVGIEGSDQVNITGFAGTFADPNVNTGPPIAVSAGLVLGGGDFAKYVIVQPTGLSANITKANQTITFPALGTKTTEDGSFTLPAFSTSGLPISYGSNNSGVATVSGNIITITGQGTASITASQAGDGNYFPATPISSNLTVIVGVIAGWDFTGQNAGPATVAATTFKSSLSSSNLITRGATAAGSTANNSFRTVGFKNDGINVTNTDYFQVTLAASAGRSLSLSTINASFAGTATFVAAPGVTSQFAYSLDGTTFTLIGSPVQSTSVTMAPVDLTSISALQTVPSGTTITIRYYASGQTNSGGWGFFSSAAGNNGLAFTGKTSAAAPTVTYSKTNKSACSGTNDGTITLVTAGSGPFTYSWTGLTGIGAHTPFTAGNVSSLTGLDIGYYNVTVTDNNQVSTTIPGIHIEYAFGVYITNSGSISSTCGNTGSIVLYGSAGIKPYKYFVSLSSLPEPAPASYVSTNTFGGLAVGDYIAYVKDSAGCVSTKPITVTAAPAIQVTAYPRAAGSCGGADGSIELYRTGGIPGYTYSLDNIIYQPSNKFTGLMAATYTGYVKDSKGCVGSLPGITVPPGASLIATATKGNSSSCVNDGAMQLQASGGTAPYRYSFDNGPFTFNNLLTGLSPNTSHTGSVKDVNNCTSNTVSVFIAENTINVTYYATAASNCIVNNGKIQLFRTGGVGPYTYSLDGDLYQTSNLFINLTPGYYSGFVKDSKTCIKEVTDIYIGPECRVAGNAVTKNSGKNVSAKVVANNKLNVVAYPNPTSTEFMLQLQGFGNGKVAIVVTDIMGRRIYQAEGSAKQQYRFGNSFNAGLYNVQVIQGNYKKSITLVKE